MGAFGGFAGGLGGGLLSQEKANDPNNPNSNTPSSLPATGNGLSGIMGGQYGILPLIKNAISGGSGGGSQSPPVATPTPGTSPQFNPVPAPDPRTQGFSNPVLGTPGASGGVPPPGSSPQFNPVVNTQTQSQPGFHGLAPMLQGYIQNHQAKVQDASAGPHVQALQDPNTTPEQRQYHISQLQSTYANRPDVLQKMGIGGQAIPNVGSAPAAPAAAAPAAAAPAPSLDAASASDGGK